VLRDRRARTATWALATAGGVTVALFVWLGPDAVPAFLRRLQTTIPATGFLIGPAAVPVVRELWTAGLGVAIGLVILALPIRGLPGIGLAILAGLCAIPNLWVHYGPTVLFAGAVLAAGLRGRRSSLGAEPSVTENAPPSGE
jgi:hypothetical protein